MASLPSPARRNSKNMRVGGMPRWRRNAEWAALAAVSVAVICTAAVIARHEMNASADREAAPVTTPRPADPLPPLPPSDVAVAAPVASADDLAAVGRRAAATAARVAPAVVAVQSPSTVPPDGSLWQIAASGVLIDPSGLILTQRHVSHFRRDAEQRTNLENPHPHRPGEKAAVILADGRRLPATLLGSDAAHDLSLLRLDDPGPYPFVPVAPAGGRIPGIAAGTWVMKFGHPLGRRADRPAPVRLGRVLATTGDAFLTDCAIISGDSGGPYFDLDGRFVGLVYNWDAGTSLAFDAALAADGRPPLGINALCGAISAPRVASLLPDLETADPPGGRPPIQSFRLEDADRLPFAAWFRGGDLGSLVTPPADAPWGDVVEVVQGDAVTGLATVVRASGPDGGAVAVTRADTLLIPPRVRIPGGELVDAIVVGFDADSNLAVLRLPAGPWRAWTVPAKGLAEAEDRAAGSVLASVGPGRAGHADATHCVSVATRAYADGIGRWATLPYRGPAADLMIDGEPSGGEPAGFRVTVAYRWAAGAVRAGDVLLAAGDRPLRSAEDLDAASRGRSAGDLLELTLIRDGAERTVRLPLPPEGKDGLPTRRTGGFAAAFEIAPPPREVRTGGPLVAPDGRFAGVVAGRPAWSNATFAIAAPPAAVAAALARLDAGALTPWGEPD